MISKVPHETNTELDTTLTWHNTFHKKRESQLLLEENSNCLVTKVKAADIRSYQLFWEKWTTYKEIPIMYQWHKNNIAKGRGLFADYRLSDFVAFKRAHKLHARRFFSMSTKSTQTNTNTYLPQHNECYWDHSRHTGVILWYLLQGKLILSYLLVRIKAEYFIKWPRQQVKSRVDSVFGSNLLKTIFEVGVKRVYTII